MGVHGLSFSFSGTGGTRFRGGWWSCVLVVRRHRRWRPAGGAGREGCAGGGVARRRAVDVTRPRSTCPVRVRTRSVEHGRGRLRAYRPRQGMWVPDTSRTGW
ncbi:hypothetical protein B005_5519 [Nocardiopsis alba ATCC BAA-2165]|uniref:Uncharacterized protein n=1 Tax=Nocardiopsis alba (strain ATCC BAA-2165 / BE74) TaxID=1205910 RepID=J7LBP6_NOCAA|nr:hypothetical protein B005_5519 [Nocardiopsis alba ATCC BAA-2165]